MMYEVTKPVGEAKYIAFLQYWEGGTSSKKSDYASKCHEGIHTVKGITWCTYQDLQAVLGNTPDYSKFLNMTQNEWNFLYNLYFRRFDLNKLEALWKKYPMIAYQVMEVYWMAGPLNCERMFAEFQRRWFKITDSDIKLNEIIDNFLNMTNTYRSVLYMLWHRRQMYYARLRDNGSKNYNGWMNRLNDLYKKFAPAWTLEKLGL
ncbi:MAG: hypothetical protein RL259_1737 [Bacteroidota bacterium]